MHKNSGKKENILRNSAFQTIIASLLCIVLGLFVGYIVLLIINPAGAGEAIVAIMKNFLYYPSAAAATKYLGTTLVKASALLMCSLSVLFAYKVGLFNIGAAGQYVVGVGACLYFALRFNMPWYVCLIAAIVTAALVGGISGALKAYFNVNEVISCIMLNWIGLYSVNMLLSQVKEQSTPYTKALASANKSALLPNLGLDQIFSKNEFVTLGLPLAVVMALAVWILLEKTKFGYELKATGMNKQAAKYCGMREKRNIILTMMIAGGLAGFGAGIFYLTGIGMLFSLLLGVAAIRFKADQTLVGTALNLLGPAAAVVLVRAINTAESVDNVSSTVAYGTAKKAFIVNIGRFEFNWFMVIALLLLAVSYIVLYKTRFGLRLCACGEHPQAADSVGINVYKMRYAGVLISGTLGGLGGLVYITAGVSEWKFENGVAGFGFLALAVMIFGQWRPVNIGLAALLFGLFRALSNVYTGFDALVALKLPSTIYNMLPYIISLIVLVFVSGKSRAPKAEGIPYDKGQR